MHSLWGRPDAEKQQRRFTALDFFALFADRDFHEKYRIGDEL
ncbi:hypothetical protein [Legionella drancourtii]|uniref:Uncharacterized protein n=1 Tax=Legionella drancourtii LLAP12 TaxID=658187 RepID=G9ETE2_9GAMM|nr:hypothetical protein [Legionella drancourtii]EHL29609.1 hypothetical protein LDG_8574 [Legionella drancourtii LLAP12]